MQSDFDLDTDSGVPGQSRGPLITFAIPLYNHARFIETCLESIYAQALPNAELILIDDGSKDNGFEIACRWRDEHRAAFVRVDFERQANAGITATMDRLIRKARGEYVLLVASDDALLPNSVEQRLPAFDDAQVMAVFGDAIPMSDDGAIAGTSAISELGGRCSRAALLDTRTLPWELVFRWNVYGSVLMCRRNALIDPSGKTILDLGIYSEDMQFYYRFATAKSLRFIDQPVAYYRLHPTNTSGMTQNLAKLRKNVQQSKAAAMREMPFLRRIAVGAQVLSYNRWDRGPRAIVTVPVAYASAVIVRVMRSLYDAYRLVVLRQESGI
jgi:GT2 family glycosyltransferase